jgi:hypothetical protein
MQSLDRIHVAMKFRPVEKTVTALPWRPLLWAKATQGSGKVRNRSI